MSLKNNALGVCKKWVVVPFIFALFFRATASAIETGLLQDLNCRPDALTVVMETGAVELQHDANGIWHGSDVALTHEKIVIVLLWT